MVEVVVQGLTVVRTPNTPDEYPETGPSPIT